MLMVKKELRAYSEKVDVKSKELSIQENNSKYKEEEIEGLKAEFKLLNKDQDVEKRTMQFCLPNGWVSLEPFINTRRRLEVLTADIEGFNKEEDNSEMRRLNELLFKAEEVEQAIRDRLEGFKEGSEDLKMDLCFSPECLKMECDDVEWGLAEVLTELYGFTDNKVKCEEEYIMNLKKCSSHEMSIESDHPFNDADFMVLDNTEEIVQEFHEWEQELASIRREKLEHLIRRINGFKTNENDTNWSLSDALKEWDGNNEVCEAVKLIMQWLDQLETDLFLLVTDLLSKLPNREAAVVKFYDFISKLEELKRRGHGRVPRVVYRILAVLEGDVGTMEERHFDDRHEKEILFREIHLDQFLDKIYKIILELEFVLCTCLANLEMDMKGILSLCEEGLKQSKKELNEIELEIYKPMNRYLKSRMNRVQKDYKERRKSGSGKRA